MAGCFGDRINSREEFFAELTRAELDVATLIERLPAEAPLKYIASQLARIREWTANGGAPSLSQRRATAMGTVMFREYETTEDEAIYRLAQTAGAVDAYVKYWPDDNVAADPDNSEYLLLP
jgi:hypothetical protein